MSSMDEQPTFVDEDDDEMADLFSFSTGDAEFVHVEPVPSAAGIGSAPRIRSESEDELFQLMSTTTTTSTEGATVTADQATKDILDWLDEDDPFQEAKEATNKADETPSKPETLSEPTVVELPPVFSSFLEALHSQQSTLQQVRDLYRPTMKLESSSDRQLCYCRIFNNNKTVADTVASSRAEAFVHFEKNSDKSQDRLQSWILDQTEQWTPQVAECSGRTETECTSDLSQLLVFYYYHSGSSSPPATTTEVSTTKEGGDVKEGREENNTISHDSIMATASEASKSTAFTAPQSPKAHQLPYLDPLIPPIAATLLSTGLSAPVSSALLTQCLPQLLPLLALQRQERWHAAHSLHTDFYRLASYHLPLLILHLDRYLPGWYGPVRLEEATEEESVTARGRMLHQQGLVPPFWLLTLWTGGPLAMKDLLSLWDILLLLGPAHNEMRFFLALSVFQDYADQLLLLTDQELEDKFQSIMTTIPEPVKDSATGEELIDTRRRIQEWWSTASFLQSCTPSSVVSLLQTAEDRAMQKAIQQRAERAEAELQARLKVEAEAHRLEQEKREEEARTRLNRARLVRFYRIHAPDKEDNIDKIMETYEGRLDELDAKLKRKYGEGFRPALKPTPAKPVSLSFLSRKQTSGEEEEVSSKPAEQEAKEAEERQVTSMTVQIKPEEVLPIVCWSKKTIRENARKNRQANRKPLQFYLVDCRSEEAAEEQGKFPTAVSLSPETLLDPEQMQHHENMFESLRGAVHIVIMGEGFSALPYLYSSKQPAHLDNLIREDEAQVSSCALFFIKKGFPFISVLDGGFAGAHSWLVREGPKFNLKASSVLVDYDANKSPFGQMEGYHSASTTEKAQRVMQNLLESSLVSMTKRAKQLESLATESKETEASAAALPIRMPIFLRGKSTEKDESTQATTDTEGSATTIKNPFAGLVRPGSSMSEKNDGNSEKPSSSPSSSATPATATTPSLANPLKNNPFKGMGAALNNSLRKDPNSSVPATGDIAANNPFRGFGAALNQTVSRAAESTPAAEAGSTSKPNSAAVAASNMLKRNPFARLGGNKGAAAPAVKEGGLRLGGWGQLGKNTMARMRGGAAVDTSSAAEEEVSFETGGSDSETKAEKPAVEKV